MDITKFVKARLDEDEAAANLAAREGGTWKQDDPDRHPGAISSLGGPVVYDEGSPDENQAAHIARYDPARALREVATKWVIVRDYERSVRACRDVTGPELDSRGYASMCGGRDALRAACLALAAAWSDHPDYRAEWKP